MSPHVTGAHALLADRIGRDGCNLGVRVESLVRIRSMEGDAIEIEDES